MNKYSLPIEFLKRFAVMVILETVNVDDMCGEPIHMATIDTEGYHNVSDEVDGIKAKLDAHNKWLYGYLEHFKG